MPWTEESDPPSASNAPKGASPSRAPDASPSEAERLGESPSEASQPNAGARPGGQRSVGPWGATPRRQLGAPLGPGPAAPSAVRPDLDQITRGLRARLSEGLHRLEKSRLRKRMLVGALIGFAAGWAASGVYEVRPDEQAVVTRLGAVATVTGPGLHAHLPWPLEQAQILAVTRVNTLMLGDSADSDSQALTPTADAQLAQATYMVQWRIADPVAYLFNVADPQGAAPLTAVMGVDRAPLQRAVAAAIQQRLNRLGAGIAVTGVSILAVGLPPEVRAAAGDVSIAHQDAEAAIGEAQAYRARTLAEAKAAAAKTLVDAQSYRDQTLQEAQGAAARFEQLDAAYRRAPGVTKDRLYFETLQGVMSRAHTVVLDAAKGATVALPPELLHPAPLSRTPVPVNGAAPASSAKP